MKVKRAGKRYGCFISHHKASCAVRRFMKCAHDFLNALCFFFIKMEARFLMEKLEAQLGKEVFLDSDDLKDLRLLLDHVRESDALVVLQSAEVLHRPWYDEHIAHFADSRDD